ncbi:hypothetical protein SAMN05216378_1358 [Paenibacillus catalpae]|uniref:Uncharacterized protein n=1 Tax=Paenibacillus catalpae TaxID=1045775 RepID=A0A1I1V9K8_9BACL|nr:hypothetical protein [Paenibacillus catalpae]SFD77090.1 hypothetical protein SAMN05216378_1358 [Paenibacillus catalpae]
MNETLSHGRELKTDTEIRQAMNAKEPILVFQDRMRLRPALPIIGYNDDIVKIADGTTFLRTATSFFTLSDEEKVTYNVSSSK